MADRFSVWQDIAGVAEVQQSGAYELVIRVEENAAGEQGEVYKELRSLDGGESWSFRLPALREGIYRVVLGPDEVASTVFAVTENTS
jgi:hypothetical protein